MVGVQLIGRESVLRAFNEVDGGSWAILQSKQFIVSGEGDDKLAAWLDAFFPSGSTATYTLRVYDADSPPDSITAGTGFVASFNFKLQDVYEGAGVSGYGGKLSARLDALEKRISGEDDEGDEDDLDITSVIMGWLKNPHQLQQAVGAFKMLLGGMGTPGAVVPAAQGVSGFGSPAGGGAAPSQEETMQRLSVVLDKLEKHDPRLLFHLEKLAELAERKPDTFKFLISNLDGF